MERISITTILIILIISCILSSIILLCYIIFYKQNRIKLGTYSVTRLIQGLSLLFFIISYKTNPNLGLIFSTFLLFPSCSLELNLLVTDNTQILDSKFAKLILFSCICSILYAFFVDNKNIRVIITSIHYASIYSYGFYRLIKLSRKYKLLLIIAFQSIFIAFTNIYRVLYNFFQDSLFNYYLDHLPNIVYNLNWLFISTSFPLIYIYKINEENSQELEKLNNTKSKILRIIGHDLKTPLANIINFAKIIENKIDYNGNIKLTATLRGIKEISEQSNNILNELNEYSSLARLSSNPNSVCNTSSIVNRIILETNSNKEFDISSKIDNNTLCSINNDLLYFGIKKVLSKFKYNNHKYNSIKISDKFTTKYYHLVFSSLNKINDKTRPKSMVDSEENSLITNIIYELFYAFKIKIIKSSNTIELHIPINLIEKQETKSKEKLSKSTN